MMVAMGRNYAILLQKGWMNKWRHKDRRRQKNQRNTLLDQ